MFHDLSEKNIRKNSVLFKSLKKIDLGAHFTENPSDFTKAHFTIGEFHVIFTSDWVFFSILMSND